MTPSDEKTDKEKKTSESTNPLGMGADTKHGLANLEVSQVELIEPSQPEKETKRDEPVPPKKPLREHKSPYDGNTRASESYRLDIPEKSWSSRLKKVAEKSEEVVMNQFKFWNRLLSKLFQSQESGHTDLKSFFEFLGPTILVSAMFFVWVVYDRSSRVYYGNKEAQADRLAIQALEEVSKGRSSQAKSLLAQAIKLSDNPEQTKKLQAILEQLK